MDLQVQDAEQKRALIASCSHQKECTERNACDVELLSVGAFSPLTGFMNKNVYDSVVENTRWALAHDLYDAHAITNQPALMCNAVVLPRKLFVWELNALRCASL